MGTLFIVWTQFAELFLPVCVTLQLMLPGVTTGFLLHWATFWPPSVAICSTLVAVVQFQPAPGHFGPA
ncbi:MAG: hypothetical protein WAQ33_12370 [Gaiellaceae bacterium]